MKRLLLPLVTCLLVGLVLVDRVSRMESTTLSAARPADSIAEPGAVAARPLRPVPPPATLAAGVAESRTPTLDRLARLAIRQQLAQATGETYLDSLVATTDSVVRRWPDRNRQPLSVAIVEGGPPDYSSRLAELMRQALARWTDAAVGVEFVEVADTTHADIVVRWIDRFEFDRAGQTDLTWDQLGRVRRATLSLALRTNTGATLGDNALLAVALHETGHAIGLPHSADTADVMFPSTRTTRLSDRDIRTATVLYRLPTGSVKDLDTP
ncbi:MAG TPA: matrixin family metalloprotease [Gemmatimonadales bacterium]|nr:matrixin family metalloprotease [Gemmatimonadales bacterium]